MGLVLLLGSAIILICLVLYIRKKNDKDILYHFSKKKAVNQCLSYQKTITHTEPPIKNSFPSRAKTLKNDHTTKEIKNEETTPMKPEKCSNSMLKGGSTLGAVEKEKIRQKLLSSNKKANNQFSLFDNEDNINNNINNTNKDNYYNRIKVLKMEDYLLKDNEKDIINNINLNDNEYETKRTQNKNEVIFENDENSILSYVF